MATLNQKKHEIDCKIVYYGPALSGKTTNLTQIHKLFNKYVTGDMISIETRGDRTLFFDFLPMELGKIRGCQIRLHLYTVPGDVQYRSTRKMVLRGVDGIVFVADSHENQRENNMKALKDLQQNLKEYGLSIYKIPFVLQHNKRDLLGQDPSLMSIDLMEMDLNRQLKRPSFSASALKGHGVGATFKKSLTMTLQTLQKELNWAA